MLYLRCGRATAHLDKFIICLSAIAIASNVKGGGRVDR